VSLSNGAVPREPLLRVLGKEDVHHVLADDTGVTLILNDGGAITLAPELVTTGYHRLRMYSTRPIAVHTSADVLQAALEGRPMIEERSRLWRVRELWAPLLVAAVVYAILAWADAGPLVRAFGVHQ
jgi:hypothetical protein